MTSWCDRWEQVAISSCPTWLLQQVPTHSDPMGFEGGGKRSERYVLLKEINLKNTTKHVIVGGLLGCSPRKFPGIPKPQLRLYFSGCDAQPTAVATWLQEMICLYISLIYHSGDR